jgi:hypothetical protein
MRFRAPSEAITGAPHRRVHPTEAGQPVRRCFLSWTSLPYDTCQLVGALMGGGSLHHRAAASGVWVPPSRPFAAGPADTEVPERPWASPSKAFSPLRAGTPLGAPALLTLSRPVAAPEGAPPEGSPSGRPSRNGCVLPPSPRGGNGRRCLPGLLLSEAFSPSVRAVACSREASPLTLGRVDVPTRLGPRASRIEWIGLARLRAACSLEVLHLPTVVALRSPVRGAGLMVSPPAGRRASKRAATSGLEPPRRRMQARIHGPRPGATVLRCTTGHLADRARSG